MDNVLGWILPDDGRLSSWIVKMLSGGCRLDEVMGHVAIKSAGQNEDAGLTYLTNEVIRLSRQDPARLTCVVRSIASWYNQSTSVFLHSHPLTSSLIWDSYRRTGQVARVFPQSESLARLDDDLACLRYEFFFNAAESAKKEPGSEWNNFGEPPKAVLKNRDLGYLHNFGRYVFADRDGREFHSQWDIRLDKFPTIEYEM